jgi:hypothetical protein
VNLGATFSPSLLPSHHDLPPEIMRVIIAYLYISLLLIIGARATTVDVKKLHVAHIIEIQHQLMENSSTIMSEAKALISSLGQENDCERSVVSKALEMCDRLNEENTKDMFAAKILKCRFRGSTIISSMPFQCWDSFYKPSSCRDALVMGYPSLWTTYENFYNYIDKFCHASRMKKIGESIQQDLQRMYEGSIDLTTVVLKLYNSFSDFQKDYADQFEKVTSGIRDLTNSVVFIREDISSVYNISKEISNELEPLSHKVEQNLELAVETHDEMKLTIKSAAELRKELEEIKKSNPFLEIREFLASIGEAFSFFLEPLEAYFNLLGNKRLGCATITILLFPWWMYLNGFMSRVFAIILPCALYHVILLGLFDTSAYILISVTVIFLLLLWVFCRLLSSIHRRNTHRLLIGISSELWEK